MVTDCEVLTWYVWPNGYSFVRPVIRDCLWPLGDKSFMAEHVKTHSLFPLLLQKSSQRIRQSILATDSDREYKLGCTMV